MPCSLKKGFFCAPLKSYGLHNYLRMSVGKDKENTLAIEALKQILEETKNLKPAPLTSNATSATTSTPISSTNPTTTRPSSKK